MTLITGQKIGKSKKKLKKKNLFFLFLLNFGHVSLLDLGHMTQKIVGLVKMANLMGCFLLWKYLKTTFLGLKWDRIEF